MTSDQDRIDDQSWLWFLTGDTVVSETSLAHQLHAVEISPFVAIAGAKQLADRKLINVGLSVAHSGKIVSLMEPNELDQGQYDHRTDVFAVSLPGMLVQTELFNDLNGFDPLTPDIAQTVDLCWRARLAGHRVAVVPAAKVQHADLPDDPSAVELAAGGTTTVDLGGVELRTYAIAIDADSNIIASATSLVCNPAADDEDANTQAIDTAYMPSTDPIRGETLVALPALADPETELVLTSDAEATVSITPVDENGEPVDTSTQELAANTAVTFQDNDAAAYLVETGANSVHAGVLIDSSAGVSAMPVNTAAETRSGLPVRIGY